MQSTRINNIIKMKRLITFFFILCCLQNHYCIAQRTFVLSVGISRYEDESKNLNLATKDAKSFRDVMLKQTKDVSILTSKFATHDNILEKLTLICEKAREKDRIFFFFSGHGFEGGLATYESYIFYSEIIDVLSRSAATTKVLFIHACHSGSMANDIRQAKFDEEMIKKGNVICVMSSRAEEFSWSVDWLSYSYFANALVKGLRGKADTNHDRQVTVIELFTYIYKDVVRKTRSRTVQHPQLIIPANSKNIVLTDWRN